MSFLYFSCNFKELFNYYPCCVILATVSKGASNLHKEGKSMKYYIVAILSSMLLLSGCGENKVKSSDELVEKSMDSLKNNADQVQSDDGTAFSMKWEEYIKNWNDTVKQLGEEEAEIGELLSGLPSLKEAEKVKTSDSISYKINLTDYATLIVNTDKKSKKVFSANVISTFKKDDVSFEDKGLTSTALGLSLLMSANPSLGFEDNMNLIDENTEMSDESMHLDMTENDIHYFLNGEDDEKGYFKTTATISM